MKRLRFFQNLTRHFAFCDLQLNFWTIGHSVAGD